MADGRQKNGGKRDGAGRKPSLNPIAAVRLRDPALQAKLVDLTRRERKHAPNTAFAHAAFKRQGEDNGFEVWPKLAFIPRWIGREEGLA